MTSFVFRETLLPQLLLWGNACAQVVRNGRNEVFSLYPSLPNLISKNVTWGKRKAFKDDKACLPFGSVIAFRKGTDGGNDIDPGRVQERDLVCAASDSKLSSPAAIFFLMSSTLL